MLIFSMCSNIIYAAGLKKQENIESAEIYVELYPREGYLHIKEYNISTLLTKTEKIKKQVEYIKELIASTKYCKKRFGFKKFIAQ